MYRPSYNETEVKKKKKKKSEQRILLRTDSSESYSNIWAVPDQAFTGPLGELVTHSQPR